jgi:hypothetical protein
VSSERCLRATGLSGALRPHPVRHRPSPTGIRAVRNVGGPDIAKVVWDKIEGKLHSSGV